MTSKQMRVGGFVLPTVVLAGIMLLIILLASIQLSLTVSNSLLDQHYQKLAREASESGALRMNECILSIEISSVSIASSSTPTIVRPLTDCMGQGTAGYVYEDSTVRTRFEGYYVTNTNPRRVDVRGIAELKRKHDGSVYKTYTYNSRQQANADIDPEGYRKSRRWWCLGGGVCIDFGLAGSSLPIPIVRSPMPPEDAFSAEGLTTISGRDGEIKFYSDGLSIWTKNHQLMSQAAGIVNGAPLCDGTVPPGQGLCGSNTGTQAVVAFPIDVAEKKYVVVSNSVNYGNKPKYGTLRYHIVDFTANPAGVITKKNIPLGSIVQGSSTVTSQYASEAMNAVPNNANNGAVVYTYRPKGPNQIYAFNIYSEDNGATIKVSNASIYNVPASPDSTPSISTNEHTSFGSINFNGDGTKMLIYMGGRVGDGNAANAGVIHIMDISGADTEMKPIASWSVGNKNAKDGSIGYSAAFSPSERYVYATKLYPGELFRYDVISGNGATIKSTERFIDFTGCEWRRACDMSDSLPYISISRYRTWESNRGGDGGGQVLAGPDGRMYVANRGKRHISVINNPDANVPSGASDSVLNSSIGWSYNGISLGNGMSMYGLPQMVTLYNPYLIHY